MATDYNALRLKANGDPVKLDEILQLECREKTSSKLADTLSRAPGFHFPSRAVAEMATSDASSAVHASLVAEGEIVLDMTLGLGIDAFSFAEKAENVIAFDILEENVESARKNADLIRLSNLDLHVGDSVEWLRDHPKAFFDTIFVDPARRDGRGRHFKLADCLPDLSQCISLIRSHCHRAILKLSPMLDIKGALRDLGFTSYSEVEIVVIGQTNECKELVLIVPGKDENLKNGGEIRCVTIGKPDFIYSPLSMPDPDGNYKRPEVGEILVEPYPSIIKAGGTPWMCEKFNLRSLHPNTHLLLVTRFEKEIPAKSFEIIDVLTFSSSIAREFHKRYPIINVSTRNFPLKAPELAKKLKVKEGGDLQLFGLTIMTGERLLVVGKRIN